uniref:Gamma-tubulin complex component n=1 Tax=Rhizophora mucronata TaxID=61149 RepID=A0A2P2L6G2_RHIMU
MESNIIFFSMDSFDENIPSFNSNQGRHEVIDNNKFLYSSIITSNGLAQSSAEEIQGQCLSVGKPRCRFQLLVETARKEGSLDIPPRR